MNIEIYADGSDPAEMIDAHGSVSGFTTNPTLMRKMGISDYENFANVVLQVITDVPISFEVFADEIPEMERQALKLASMGDNVYVKIPITNTKGESTHKLVSSLLHQGVKIHVTAVLCPTQMRLILPYMESPTDAILSIFAGRISDTGIDPIPIFTEALRLAAPNVKILWASTRQAYNIYEADAIGCHIITAPPAILKKLSLGGKNLEEYSLDTVKMFYNDAKASGYTL
jgi:transaldolase